MVVQTPTRSSRADHDRALPAFRARRTTAGTGSPAVVQLVCAELALLGVAGALLSGSTVALGVATGIAVLLLGAASGRIGGRWWYQIVGTWWRLRHRARAAARAAAVDADPRSATLAALHPGLTIRTVVDRGTSLGVGQDRSGWFAVLELAPMTQLSGERLTQFGVDRLARILDEAYVPISSVQLVSFRVPTPTVLVDENAPCARSYRELTAEARCPLQDVSWLAVRLNPADATEAAASRGGGMAGVDRAFAAAVGRIGKSLDAADVPYQLLDADGLRQALLMSGGLDGTVPVHEQRAVEHWSTWVAAGLAHAGYAIRSWPVQPRPELLAELGDVPAAAVSVSVTVRPLGEHTVLSGLVRIAAPPGRLLTAARQLTANARRLVVRLRRLDGEQAFAVYATAPSGGGAMRTLASAHLVDRAATGRLVALAGRCGVVLGRDDAGAPVIVRLLRPEPTRVALVGGWWSARLIAFRMLGVGARVVVRTTAPNMWAGLGEAAGAADRVQLIAPGSAVELVGGAGNGPVLQVDDVGLGGAPDRPNLGPWRTQLTLLPQLTSHGAQVLAEAQLVMVQRLGQPDAELATGVLRLPEQTAGLLQQMHDDMVAIVGGGADRYAWFAPSVVERQVLGPPRRA